MSITRRRFFLAALPVAGVLAISGCDGKSGSGSSASGPMQQLGQAAQGVAAKAEGAANQAIEAVKGEANKWVSDVVDKQWPAAKQQLEAATAKIGSIQQADVKAKAEALANDLKGQIPAIEELVGKVKNFTTGDLGALFSEAKAKFDGFTSKLGELNKLVGQ